MRETLCGMRAFKRGCLYESMRVRRRVHIDPFNTMPNHLYIPQQVRPGRTTVSMYCHRYNPETGKTVTIYVGSFRVDLDPAEVPQTPLAAGQRCAGISISPQAPFSLETEHLLDIQRWLIVHGSYLRDHAIKRSEKAKETAVLKAQLREEIRRELEHESAAAREVFETHTVGWALLEAEEALRRAIHHLPNEVAAAKAKGVRLRRIRSLNTQITDDMSALDVLQALVNRIRLTAISDFEQACKATGLMIGSKRRKDQ